MRWERLRRSNNVEDRRGQAVTRRPAAAGGGCGLVLLLVLALLFKVNPLELLSQGGLETAPTQQTQGTPTSAESDEMAEYVRAVVGSTEDEWRQIFQKYGLQYRDPKLINYSGQTRMKTGGVAQAATGPFYLPAEETIYLDTQFFYQLKQMARDRTRDYDFAPAYVIAHEVAHHVQKLLGYTDKVHGQRGRVSQRQYNDLSVRLELQADFLAGVWAHHANKRMMATDGVPLLEEGDVEEAMRAAQAIGDDALQRQANGRVRPDSFTHGTSEQRLRWFMKGLKSGDPNQGNTFDPNVQL
ncbi:KPN_02809 family neutral zinc metallopeptidase [Roseibacillus persicicus]|uniref:KPN_02809 family neutral zinc metallopeptidase n=1 Tax=Roseibacillus persicicus TaxID=454148 RepID=UPI00167AB501|nr:neutral zinc metallopeptidase [Roseibacillus persicicus]MDQ8189436.1 neutral zinc metallopeptidase [Roseibacillus persicicus]